MCKTLQSSILIENVARLKFTRGPLGVPGPPRMVPGCSRERFLGPRGAPGSEGAHSGGSPGSSGSVRKFSESVLFEGPRVKMSGFPWVC